MWPVVRFVVWLFKCHRRVLCRNRHGMASRRSTLQTYRSRHRRALNVRTFTMPYASMQMCLTLGHPRRRWANIKVAMVLFFVLFLCLMPVILTEADLVVSRRIPLKTAGWPLYASYQSYRIYHGMKWMGYMPPLWGLHISRARALVCLESRRSWVRTQLWQSSFKEKNVSSPLTRKDSIL